MHTQAISLSLSLSCPTHTRQLNKIMSQVDLMQALFERAGGAKHAGVLSTLARKRKSRSSVWPINYYHILSTILEHWLQYTVLTLMESMIQFNLRNWLSRILSIWSDCRPLPENRTFFKVEIIFFFIRSIGISTVYTCVYVLSQNTHERCNYCFFKVTYILCTVSSFT